MKMDAHPERICTYLQLMILTIDHEMLIKKIRKVWNMWQKVVIVYKLYKL